MENQRSKGINQLCFCKKKLEKQKGERECVCCCKPPLNDNMYYWCGDMQCQYIKIAACGYTVCSECFNAMNDGDFVDDQYGFLDKKIGSTLNIIRENIKKLKNNKQIKKYMVRVYLNHYQKWIGRLKNEEMVQLKFNKFYDSILNEIGIKMDAEMLELDDNNIIFNTYSSKSESITASIKEVGLNWSILKTELLELEKKKAAEIAKFENMSCVSDYCSSCHRLRFFNEIYCQYFLSKYIDNKSDANHGDGEFLEILLNSMADYDGICMLNDYDHLKQHHLFSDFSICSSINCVESNFCDLALREYGNNEDSKWDDLQSNLIEIASKIHFKLNHDISSKKQSDFIKIRSMKYRKQKETEHNKFLIEFSEKKESKKGLMDELYDGIVGRNGLCHNKAAQLMNYLIDQNYDSEAIIFDLINDDDEHNKYKQSNLYKQPFLNKNKKICKIIKNHLGATKMSDDHKGIMFKFGECWFKHWDYFEGDDDYIKSPKHSSLKDELLNNKIYSMEINVFNAILKKAFIYHQTSKAKTLRARDIGLENIKFEIPANFVVTISHLMSLITYTDYTKIQHEFKKIGCRKSKENQSLNDLIEKNKEIGIWYKLINEAVWIFGERATESDRFYTGLNIRLLFESFVPRFKCIFSTTTNWGVAHRFSDETGCILTLIPNKDCMDRYMNCAWFSCFENESEKLFCKADNLRISDIQTFAGNKMLSYSAYLAAFSLWSQIFGGQYYIYGLREDSNRKLTQNVLVKLIKNYNDQNNIVKVEDAEKIMIPMFMQQTFYQIITTMKNDAIFFIKSEFGFLGSSLRAQIGCIEKDNDDSDKMVLTPFVSSLIGDNNIINMMDEYFWCLSDSELKQLKTSTADQWLYCAEKYIYKSWKTNISFSMRICRRGGGSDQSGFCLDIKGLSRSSISGMFSIAIDELKWCINDVAFYNLIEGGYEGIYFFPDHLIDSLSSLLVRLSIFFY